MGYILCYSAILVPPQQQLVDTSSNAPSIVEAFSSSPSSSSHTDYNMPSTSSSVSHMTVRQVVVTPTQQTSHSAESTQVHFIRKSRSIMENEG